tara:strand:- start:87 stop:542 length:456 start_codon:yes stop_codon:yes gene_type:complete
MLKQTLIVICLILPLINKGQQIDSATQEIIIESASIKIISSLTCQPNGRGFHFKKVEIKPQLPQNLIQEFDSLKIKEDLAEMQFNLDSNCVITSIVISKNAKSPSFNLFIQNICNELVQYLNTAKQLDIFNCKNSYCYPFNPIIPVKVSLY